MFDTEKGFISKVIGHKRRWREYKARVRAASRELPHGGRSASSGT